VKNPREIAAAGFAGAVATGVDVVTLVLLVERVRGISIPIAAFLGAIAGAVMNFVLNKYIAFRDPSRVTAQQLGRFGIVAVASAMLMALAMKIVAVELGVPYLVAKLLCAVVVFVGWSYPAQRRLVFSPSVAAA